MTNTVDKPIEEYLITRFEVIDHRTGKEVRAFVAKPCQISLSVQDDGRTLKVFVADGVYKEDK